MELIKQNLELEHDNLAHADYIFLSLMLKLKNRQIKNVNYTKHGIVLSEFKTKKGDKIELIINAAKGGEMSEIHSFLIDKESEKDPEVIKEFFINNTSDFIRFSDHAYLKFIKNEDPFEMDLVFTNYLEAVEYLQQLEN